ncbi:unnamed protein product, partial [Larinioides sclopetarius]
MLLAATLQLHGHLRPLILLHATPIFSTSRHLRDVDSPPYQLISSILLSFYFL